ncbi:hypothetical protein HBN50_00060 [Halobacteriovorax sp. GB3]|uniref:hypothetical protein n=1 Tax=Halobacteriovorax sp. GB3 TaxID=2719615 RepID=UPI0023608284|nr:hypothetical protein [Halobacteriovorax sp. GB3]MDD0851459.1 hypothetical protein [Halobacteriovorax sp. GB3]
MKLFFLSAALLLTSTVFSYDEGLDAPKKCQREACLVVGDNEIGFYKREHQEGGYTLELNQSSLLTSLRSGEVCYRGQFFELASIFKALAGNVNSDYAQGGHLEINDLQIKFSGSDYRVKYLLDSDYQDKANWEELVVNKCN